MRLYEWITTQNIDLYETPRLGFLNKSEFFLNPELNQKNKLN